MIHILLALGIGLAALGISKMLPYWRARNWQPWTARIISISEAWSDVSMRYWMLKYYFPKIEYDYEFNGAIYKSEKVSFEKQNIWQPEVDAWGVHTDKGKYLWAPWKNESTIAIYVNPDNPTQSVIVKDLDRKRRSHHLAFTVGGLVVIVVWALLYLSNQQY